MRAGSFLLICLILISALPGSTLSARRTDHAQDELILDDQIDAIIESWTPEERVGQLMLVTFEGSNLGPDSAVRQLIRTYNIGGVVLLAANDNINGQVNTPRLVQSLTRDLQQLAHDSALGIVDQTDNTDLQIDAQGSPRAYAPLFIATTHAGNGLPGTQIAGDTTPLPSQMALGATWNPDYAEQVGQIAGAELDAMGINMLLGPALDVAQPAPSFDLGVNTFGGEPDWVGKMGAAYISGVHSGSRNRIAVIAQHFPGLGLADTDPDLRVPVVPRSAKELDAFDLIPFQAVTGGALDTAAQADGLQCVNISYQDANTRASTRPVCVDEMAMGALLQLDDLAAWRESGIMVSSPLGIRALRRYYDVEPFPHRQVAREAFLAGNDLLYLADFGPDPGDDQRENVIDTITFFAERYTDDPVFRARVEQSLRRILRLKLQLYGADLSTDDLVDTVQRSPNTIDTVGGDEPALYGIAQDGVTLLALSRESLPPPPDRDETIVIFTDVRMVQQCSYCATYPLVSANALEMVIERMYGPDAGAQVQPEHVASFSFDQLQTYLTGDLADTAINSSEFMTNQRIKDALRDVDWVVFMLLDVVAEEESSDILRHLIEAESSIVEDTRVIVMALGAPTYLSATDISKLTAYYGIYSHTPPYIDAAARALFQENSLPGALPISVPAVGYDVLVMTLPDPDQTIQLEIDSASDSPVIIETDAEVVTMQVGNELPLRTLPIVDHNGHPVPNLTPVTFALTFVTDNIQTQQTSTTLDGIARTIFRPTRPGRVQITASSLDADRSTTVQIVVNAEESAAGSGDPTQAALAGDQPANVGVGEEAAQAGTPIAAEEGALGNESNPVSASVAEGSNEQHRLGITDFVLAAFVLTVMSLFGFSAGRAITLSADGGLRVVLGGVIAGLTGYIYYGLNGPGAAALYNTLDNLAPMVITLVSGLVGLVYAWWFLRQEWR